MPISSTIVAEHHAPTRPLKKGDEVFVSNAGQKGVLLSDPDKNGNVDIQAGIITMRTDVSNLRLFKESKKSGKSAQKRSKSMRNISLAGALPTGQSFSPELDLRGQVGEDAWYMTDKYIDDAILSGMRNVRLIHGKGTGALRAYLWQCLKRDRRVSSYRIGVFGEGDSGVTVLELK